MEEILFIDKPAGITSFDVIRRLRVRLPPKTKLGHAGTLDPMATGLMIIAIGHATKELKKYLKLPKVYEAEVLLGIRTDTGDQEGRQLPITNSQFPNKDKILELSGEDIMKVLGSMEGKLTLPVPRYSAIRVRGKRLYARARKGEEFEPPKKEMEVKKINFQGIRSREQGVSVMFEVEVASGTYIRSLAEELGYRLGIPAVLWNLRRTRIGKFSVNIAQKLE